MSAKKPICIALAICLACLLAQDLSAQIRTAWLTEYSGPAGGEDIGFVVALDSAHNVVVGGWTGGPGTGRDLLLLKYNRTGKLLWSRTYDGIGNGDDHTSSIVIDSNDDIVLVGTTDGGSSGIDIIVLRHDPDGTQLWSRTFNGTGNGTDYASGFGSLAMDPAGNAYVTGYSRTAAGHYELVVIRYLPDGTEDWVTRFTGPHPTSRHTFGWSLALAPSGFLYVGGDTWNVAGDRDYLLLKVDAATGTVAWDSLFDGLYGLDDSVYSIALDQNENTYLTGVSDTSGGFEYCVMKADANGLFQWEGRYGGTAGFHYGWVIDVDTLGNSYVSGASMTTGGEYDIVTVKFDTNGALQWDRRYRDNQFFGEDWANDVKVGPDGNIYVTGRIWRYFVSGFDACTLKYDPAGTLLWDEVYEGPLGGNDSGFSLVIDDDSNVFMVGTTLGAATGSDAMTVKYSQLPPPALAATPDPLQPGQQGALQAINMEPLTPTFLAYSVLGSSPTFIPPINVTLGLQQPRQLGPPMTADGAGSAGWGAIIPPSMSGLNIWFQAAQYNQVTNVVATFVQ